MLGDIVQEINGGWFYRDNGDGTFDNLSAEGGATVATATKVQAGNLRKHVVLVRDGQPTGDGDPLAARVATVMARRYA